MTISTVEIDSPVWASHYNQVVNAVNNGVIALLDDIADLIAIDTTSVPGNTRYELPNGIYKLNLSSSKTADGLFVVAPASGPGKWELTFASVELSASSSSIFIQQSGHGFAVGNVIRHNGTSWLKAQGNSIQGCTDVWFVFSVPDSNNFKALKTGRVTVASHGLAVGSLYYLSSSTAGLLTEIKPIGSTTQPLGFFLPVLFVESSTVVHVLGNSYPEMISILAEFVPGSDFTSTLTFSNLDINSLPAKRVHAEVLMYRRQDSGSGSGAAAAPGIRVNGVSSNYQCSIERVQAAATFTRNDYYNNNSNAFVVASGENVRSNLALYKTTLTMGDDTVFASSELEQRFVSSRGRGYIIGQSNVTEISVIFSSSDNNWRLQSSSNNYVRLFQDV